VQETLENGKIKLKVKIAQTYNSYIHGP